MLNLHPLFSIDPLFSSVPVIYSSPFSFIRIIHSLSKLFLMSVTVFSASHRSPAPDAAALGPAMSAFRKPSGPNPSRNCHSPAAKCSRKNERKGTGKSRIEKSLPSWSVSGRYAILVLQFFPSSFLHRRRRDDVSLLRRGEILGIVDPRRPGLCYLFDHLAVPAEGEVFEVEAGRRLLHDEPEGVEG